MLKISSTVRIITILLTVWTVHTEKIHFARYLNTDLFPMRSHKVVSESVSSCVDKCKAYSECNYINYHIASHLCHLIDDDIGHDVITEDILDQAKGYVFGNKANWTTILDSGCLSCQGDGKCTLNVRTLKGACPVSGCRPPDSKSDATIRGNMHDVGNKVKFECTDQFEVGGAMQHISTCLENGNWSSTDVQCLHDCGPVPFVANGSVALDIPGNTTEGAGATVDCDLGYVPENSQIFCQPSGWEIPLCLQTHNFTCRLGTTWEYAGAAACDCVLECSELTNTSCLCMEHQERFMVLPNHYIPYNNIMRVGNMTEKSCSALCRDTPGCRSADFWSSTCNMNRVMPHEVNPNLSEFKHLILRMCDQCN